MQRSIERESVSRSSWALRAHGQHFWLWDKRRRPKNSKRKTLRTHRLGR